MKFLEFVFQDFIDALELATDESHLVMAADRAAKRMGFRWFAYFGSGKRGLKVISSYPKDWVQHYLDENYDRVDPVVAHPRRLRRALEWDGSRNKLHSTEQQRLFNEARDFRITTGLTVPIWCGGSSFAAFTLASDNQSDETRRRPEEVLDALQLIGLYFHTHVLAKIQIEQARVGNAALTLRERECLSWAARGKTMAETSQILNIARRTVEFHLDNARVKLQASTISQAVAEDILQQTVPQQKSQTDH